VGLRLVEEEHNSFGLILAGRTAAVPI